MVEVNIKLLTVKMVLSAVDSGVRFQACGIASEKASLPSLVLSHVVMKSPVR